MNISMGNELICVRTILASSQEQGLQDDVVLIPGCLDLGKLFTKSECQHWALILTGGDLITNWLSVSILFHFLMSWGASWVGNGEYTMCVSFLLILLHLLLLSS